MDEREASTRPRDDAGRGLYWRPSGDSSLPRRLSAVLLLVLAPLPPPALAAGKEFRGKRVPLAEAPFSQLASARHPVRRLGPALNVGGAEFPVSLDDAGRLRVATAPGGTPSPEAVPGKPLLLAWKEGDVRREARLAFAPRGGGAWVYWNAEAVRFEVAGEAFRLFDADADGRFGDPERDGWCAGDANQVLPFAREFALGPNLVTLESVEPDGSRITASTAPLPGTPAQVAALVALDRLRTANGLPPVALDPALSAGCSAHADYLVARGWSGHSDPHAQEPGSRGATEAGAAAARRSVITMDPPAASIAVFWRTAYHRLPLACPWLDRVGLNAAPPHLTVLDAGRGPAGALGEIEEDVTSAWALPTFVPSDGSVGIPVAAGPELPREPVPRLATRGPPLLAIFLWDTPVDGFAGTLEEEGASGPRRIGVLVGDPGEFPWHRSLVPGAPLRPATWYRAEFTWKSFGREERRTVRFRTE